MRRAAAALAVAAGVAAGAAHATSPASSSARPVRATLTLGAYPLQCGRPRGSAVVTFPAAVTLPRTIAAAAVQVNGRPAARVSLSGRNVTVTAPLVPGITCMSITLGRLTVLFTAGANIGNPTSAGAYTVTVRHGTQTYRAKLTIGA